MERRILIVDDEAPVCEVLATYLSREGFGTATATSAQDALERISETPFQLVILDIGLAKDNGLELLPRLKSQRPRPRVVMLTGFGYDADLMNDALQKGADGYVAKGTSMEDLLAAVNRALEP